MNSTDQSGYNGLTFANGSVNVADVYWMEHQKLLLSGKFDPRNRQMVPYYNVDPSAVFNNFPGVKERIPLKEIIQTGIRHPPIGP